MERELACLCITYLNVMCVRIIDVLKVHFGVMVHMAESIIVDCSIKSGKMYHIGESLAIANMKEWCYI